MLFFKSVALFIAFTTVRSRVVQDKTPTPCKEKYDHGFIGTAAQNYVAGFPTNQNPARLLLLLGGSGAGKGTFMKHLAKHGFPEAKFVKHGLDDYIEVLPEWQETKNHPENVYKDGADSCYAGGAIPLAKEVQKIMLNRRMSAIYEETGKNLDRILTRVLPPFLEAGYEISVALVDNSEEVAQSRAAGRFQKEGRYAPPAYIASTFKGVFPNYLKLKQREFVHEAVYCDNSCKGIEKETTKPGECLRCWKEPTQKRKEHNSHGASGSGFTSVLPEAAFLKGKPEYANHQGMRSAEL